MYLAVRVELAAWAYAVRRRYFQDWKNTPTANNFINADAKAAFLTRQLAITSNTELKAKWWKSHMEFLSTDITVMLDEKIQYECFTKVGLSGLYAFICICSEGKEPPLKLRDLLGWEKKIITLLKYEKTPSDLYYEKIKEQYRCLLGNIVELSKHRRIKVRFKAHLMHWNTKTVKVINEEDGSEIDVNISDMICVTHNPFEKQRKKDEIATLDLIDGKAVALSGKGYYESKLFETKPKDEEKNDKHQREQGIIQGDNSVVVMHNDAPVNITKNVYIRSPLEDKEFCHALSSTEIVNEKLPEPNNVG